MPVFDVLNPNATASLAFQGLSVFCFNQAFNGGQGRWEIAVPQFSGHEFLITFSGVGKLRVSPVVKRIEIKARVGVPTAPKHMPGAFDRKDKVHSDSHDYRWLVDFTDQSEIPHGDASIIKRSDDPFRPDVTMIY